MYKILVTDLNEMKQQLRTELAELNNVVIMVRVVADSSRSVMHVCTPSLAIFLTCCYQLDSNSLNLEIGKRS